MGYPRSRVNSRDDPCYKVNLRMDAESREGAMRVGGTLR
jgi:hypothetical protein